MPVNRSPPTRNFPCKVKKQRFCYFLLRENTHLRKPVHSPSWKTSFFISEFILWENNSERDRERERKEKREDRKKREERDDLPHSGME